MSKKIVVIGGGAAGMMAAISAAERGAQVTLLEPNERLGKKLNITGKGRCNVTNNCSLEELMSNIPCNGKFLYSAFSRFSSQDTMTFFEALGVPLKTERGNRVFPQSDCSFDISDALRRRIGIVPQDVAVSDELTVQENIDFFCGLYVDDRKKRKELVEAALHFAGLEQFRRFRPKKLSGGLLRRLNIACGIAHKPDLIFMDEPTVAVDPQSRQHILDGIKQLQKQGATIIYTTHYMEEVGQICDRVAIIDSGKNIALGTVDELKKLVPQTGDTPPTLNDVFLELTGRQLRDM